MKSSQASVGLLTQLIASFLPNLLPSPPNLSSDTAAALSPSPTEPALLTWRQSLSKYPQRSPILCPCTAHLTDPRLLYTGSSLLPQSQGPSVCSLCLAITADFHPAQETLFPPVPQGVLCPLHPQPVPQFALPSSFHLSLSISYQ